jgi:hypothetical protein
MEPVDSREIDDLKEYLATVSGTRLLVDGNEMVDLLKADVKERNGEAFLIFRYQLIF